MTDEEKLTLIQKYEELSEKFKEDYVMKKMS